MDAQSDGYNIIQQGLADMLETCFHITNSIKNIEIEVPDPVYDDVPVEEMSSPKPTPKQCVLKRVPFMGELVNKLRGSMKTLIDKKSDSKEEPEPVSTDVQDASGELEDSSDDTVYGAAVFESQRRTEEDRHQSSEVLSEGQSGIRPRTLIEKRQDFLGELLLSTEMVTIDKGNALLISDLKNAFATKEKKVPMENINNPETVNSGNESSSVENLSDCSLDKDQVNGGGFDLGESALESKPSIEEPKIELGKNFLRRKMSPTIETRSPEESPIYGNYSFPFVPTKEKKVYIPAEKEGKGRKVSPVLTPKFRKENLHLNFDKGIQNSETSTYVSMTSNENLRRHNPENFAFNILSPSRSPSPSPRERCPVIFDGPLGAADTGLGVPEFKVNPRLLRRSQKKFRRIVAQIGDDRNYVCESDLVKDKLMMIETKVKHVAEKLHELSPDNLNINHYLNRILASVDTLDKVITETVEKIKENEDLDQADYVTVIYRNRKLHQIKDETLKIVRDTVFSAPMYQTYALSTISDSPSTDDGYTTMVDTCEPVEEAEHEYANVQYHRMQECHRVDCVGEGPDREESVKKKDRKKVKRKATLRDMVCARMEKKKFDLVNWCHLQEVVHSGVLGRLTKFERNLYEAKYEIISSKSSYLKSLSVLQAVFMDNAKLAKMLSREEHDNMFKYIRPIKSCSELFLTDLLSGWPQDVFLKNMLTVVSRYADSGLQAYVDFCENKIKMDDTLRSIRLNQRVKEEIAFLESDEICNNHSLESFLVLPIQRITRFPILVEAIFKHMEPDEEDYVGWQETFAKLTQKAVECNEAVRRSEQLKDASPTTAVAKVNNRVWHKLLGSNSLD